MPPDANDNDALRRRWARNTTMDKDWRETNSQQFEDSRVRYALSVLGLKAPRKGTLRAHDFHSLVANFPILWSTYYEANITRKPGAQPGNLAKNPQGHPAYAALQELKDSHPDADVKLGVVFPWTGVPQGMILHEGHNMTVLGVQTRLVFQGSRGIEELWIEPFDRLLAVASRRLLSR